MAYTNTTLLGLNQPTTGSESGVWGDDINLGTTILVELAVAGTNNITTDGDVTLAVSNGSSGSSFTSTATNSTVAQYYILNCTGARTAARNIIAPATSRSFLVTNGTTGGFGITVKKSAGTGVTVVAGETAIVYYNTVTGDYAKATTSVATAPGGSNTYVQYNSSGSFAGSANHTFDGTTMTLGNAGVSARFQGDFSNATFSTRTAFVTGTTNATTGIYALPNGTSTAASWQATNNSDPTNASKILIATNGSTDVQLVSGINGTGTYLPLSFYTNGSQQMQLSTSGNLGVGVTPSAWGNIFKVIDFYGNGSVAGSSAAITLFDNAYYNGTNYVYKTTNYASRYGLNAGVHYWYTAPSGTAGNAITFTQAMTLDASGNLGVGTTSALSRIDARAASATMGNYQTIQAFSTDTAASVDLGGGISLGGFYNSTQIAQFGSIVGRKENGTSGNYAGYLAFGTNSQATGVREVARISSTGGFSVGTTADPGAGAIYATGNITAYYSSDAKFKENVQDVPDALGIVTAIGSKTFEWTDEYLKDHGGEDEYFQPKQSFGVIAQDVQKVFPQAVRTREDGSLAVDYEKLAILSFGAISQLLKRVEALESK